MNGRTFIAALALVAVIGVWSSAQPGPSGGPVVAPQDDGLTEPPPGPPGPPTEAFGPDRPARVEQMMERIRQTWPDQHRRLEALRHNPRLFYPALTRTAHLLRETEGLSPELREAFARARADNVRLAELVRRYRATSESQRRQELRKQIEALVARQFDDTQALRQHRLDQFARQLDQLREQIEQRRQNRQQVIDARVEDLLTGQGRQPW